MNEELARVVGERVRLRRTAARRKQVVVAGLTGISADYLYQIERGMKLPTIPVLVQLAEVLGVPVGELLGSEPTGDHPPSRSTTGEAVYRAMTDPVPKNGDPPPLRDLHERVVTAWRVWQTSPQRYSTLSALLPGLITDIEAVVQTHRVQAMDGDRRAAQRCLVDLYGLVRTDPAAGSAHQASPWSPPSTPPFAHGVGVW